MKKTRKSVNSLTQKASPKSKKQNSKQSIQAPTKSNNNNCKHPLSHEKYLVSMTHHNFDLPKLRI